MSKECNCKVRGSREYNNILELEKFLKALSDKSRLRILCLIKDEILTVSEIQQHLKIPQNMTSHHIAKLKRMGLLIEQREGAFRRYTVNPHIFNRFCDIFKEVTQTNADSIGCK